MDNQTVFYATGKRKSAIAKTWLKPGKGEIIINNKPVNDYFELPAACDLLRQPLELVESADHFDIKVSVLGGGKMGQAGAVRHGITRALILANPEFRDALKKAGFITRDDRVKERKKYGQRGARARFQFSKR
ncbi:MAG: 30S ribosomal protein S9 [Deltaproteobacteria bacterium]|nr:MAG: 30S ribosomal protein S9 [Deltaproteobacteria bacterium]